jgi:hypothetical protein
VKAEGETVTIRSPRRLRLVGRGAHEAEVALSAAVPRRIEVWGGAPQ